MQERGIIYTDQASCQDCYRCVRVCPVKAIRWKDGQASVIAERCVLCGTCIRECPQKAKKYRNDIPNAKMLIQRGKTAVSLAPSFRAAFPEPVIPRLPSALRKLGFAIIGETAVGAYHHIAALKKNLIIRPHLSVLDNSCPAVVEYVEKYEPKFIQNIGHIPSPMVLHALHLRANYPDVRNVVFIGPCIAKKGEAERPEYTGIVDCVLTFEELSEWLTEENIIPQYEEESCFDDPAPAKARFYPVKEGMFRLLSPAEIGKRVGYSVSGQEDIRNFLRFAEKSDQPVFAEILFCRNGCIQGPALGAECNPFMAQKIILNLPEQNSDHLPDELITEIGMVPVKKVPQSKNSIGEDDIKNILSQMGKMQPEDELDCGSCGYSTCRDKARAVLEGMAEIRMCLPFMRAMAEQRSDRIIETSPNGIMILNRDLEILKINPSFQRMFQCGSGIIGKHASYLMDISFYEKLLSGEKSLVEETREYPSYNLILHQMAYLLPEDHQIVSIFVNITNQVRNREKLETLRQKSILQARELLEHQIQMAQQMAKFLGEQTARGEMLVENLLQWMENEGQ